MILAIIFGCIVGFALGLTGGGGSIFAIPLLVYGLSIAPREAVAISLASVGGTAAFRAVPSLFRGQVDLRTGLLFAIAGMLGAPVGSLIATVIPENLLLVLFACLMVIVAQRMWSKARKPQLTNATSGSEAKQHITHSACQRDADGKLHLTSRCARLLVLIGIGTGVLSGLFGVGGGIVIVPALVLFSGMAIHAAVSTSLFVIVLISISGVSSQLLAGNELPVKTTLLFMLGGFAGMGLGSLVAKQMDECTLQRIFSIAIIMVAIFVALKSLVF